ncbi:nicotinate-nucleotide adenylyltransferase [Sphingobium sufflavum]|uniref:nicotinate-nucleotide adenylyltransferase n=1 Tax=Sphingobium sufflavum TaxID=1129547 RepID=UPI001F34E47E|nr:nicotinate-nucleotide adenylyltransferase [Sphingobium sufflavum]MCE7795121.1 nicotinate-nucleotide adenylyltransferase [Sphingobium sufflavum]
MRPPPRTVGLMGGSFNPAHGGHRFIALETIRALGLDEVWWLVSPGNPLKDRADMAPLAARYASAFAMARRARIRPTVIERDLGTRYTIDTLRALRQRYPHIRFIWIMGADNLRQFQHWKNWRGIAQTMAIAVIARPGYDSGVHGTSAMTWLRRFVLRLHQRGSWTQWRIPALVHLRFCPDRRSATQLRRANPHWHFSHDHTDIRDAVTHRAIPVKE